MPSAVLNRDRYKAKLSFTFEASCLNQLMMLFTYHMTVAEVILILVMISTDIHMPFKRDPGKHSFN